MAINEQLKNSITHTLSQLPYSGQDYIEEAREAVRRADYQAAAEILRSHGHALTPDPRTDIIKFDYEKHVKDSIKRFNENNPSTSGLEQAIIAAALAWREADGKLTTPFENSDAWFDETRERHKEVVKCLAHLRAACDKYVEAKEK